MIDTIRTCPQHGFADPEALAPFHLLLGSTSCYLPAQAYASDRHVTDVICVMSWQSLVCHIDLLHPNICWSFLWIIIEINISLDDIVTNNLILPIFAVP